MRKKQTTRASQPKRSNNIPGLRRPGRRIATAGSQPQTSPRQPLLGRLINFLPAAGGSLLAATMLLPASALAGPSGGVVSAGDATINQQSSVTTIMQQSQRAVYDWNDFSIAANEGVYFQQPNTSAIALNRVVGNAPSHIFGQLQATGQIFLINPHGVLIGPKAQIDVHGLLATTMDITTSDFMAGRDTFTRLANAGEAQVINQGRIIAAEGGYVVLAGDTVGNSGVIEARLGQVALAAGNRITLDLHGDELISLAVDEATLAHQAGVENTGLLQADGGRVLMTAKTADALTATVVNNQGQIQARTIEERDGEIYLLGSMDNGTVRVGGSLDASAPDGGDGGFIETSGHTVKVDKNARVTTTASQGKTGEWLIDPKDYIIAPATQTGDTTGGDVSAWLSSSNITIANDTSNLYADEGNIYVLDSIFWNTANTLTLKATNNIIFVAGTITNGSGGGIVLRADADADSRGSVSFGDGSRITTTGVASIYYNPTGYNTPNDFSPFFWSGLGGYPGTGVLNTYMLVNDATQLQAMTTNLTGAYALGKDIDATATATWNSGLGFLEIGSGAVQFNGLLDGEGHAINNLYINRPDHVYAGLFGFMGANGKVTNVNLSNANITAQNFVGGLVGRNDGLIGSSSSSGSVAGISEVGGLVGINNGTVTLSSSAAIVTGSTSIGGLVGDNNSSITNSSSSATVTGTATVGGLVGANEGSINNSFQVAASEVTGDNMVGGLVGANGTTGLIANSTSSGKTTGLDMVGGVAGINHNAITESSSSATAIVAGTTKVGGLVGYNATTGTISAADSSAQITGSGDFTGGLVGYNDHIITTSESHAVVQGVSNVGGLAGANNATIQDSNNFGSVTGTSTNTGGLAGLNTVNGSILRSGNTGTISGADNVGGLAGTNSNAIDSSSSSGNVTGEKNVGGQAGVNDTTGTINNSSSTGTVTGLSTAEAIGGVAGINHHIISYSWSSASVSGSTFVGGVAGKNLGAITFSNSSGNILGIDEVGGLVGFNDNAITDSFSTAHVSGTSYVGGIAGTNKGTITRSFVTSGSVYGDSNVGGLVGYNFDTITNSHYSIVGVDINDRSAVTLGGLYLDQYQDWLSDKTLNIADYNDTLTLDVTSGAFLISSALGMQNLLGFADNPNYSFRLASDIDLNAVPGFHIPLLNADFNGMGFTISHLSVNQTFTSDLGLFGVVGYEAEVRDLLLTLSSITGAKGAGLLTGYNDGIISNVQVSGTVGGSESVGGLAGSNSGVISGSASAGTVTGAPGALDVGGLVGYNYFQVSNSSSSANVSGTAYVGGLVGGNEGTIEGSSSSGNVTGVENVGGLVGDIYNRIKNSHYDIEQVLINGAHAVTLGGLYHTQYLDWQPDKTLNIVDYSEDLPYDSLDGAYRINSITGLKYLLGFADVVNTDGTALYSFRLTANIDLSTAIGLYIPLLANHFNGAGHTISNLKVQQSYTSGLGMFGKIEETGRVHNLGLSNVTLHGFDDVGGLAGWNAGEISNAYSAGTISGNGYVGGLVGENIVLGNIDNTYSTGSVSGSKYTGGLVGYNYKTISRSYSTSAVTDALGIGASVGGLIGGSNASAVTNNSFWDMDSSGQNTSGGGLGKNTSDMKTMSTFTGWDIANTHGAGTTWRIYEGATTPLLSVFLAPITVTPSDINTIYSGGQQDFQVLRGPAGFTLSGLRPGDDGTSTVLGLSEVSASGHNAGFYPLTPQETLYSTQQGYDIGYTQGSLTIDRASLSVSAYDASKAYDAIPYSGGNGYTIFGFVNGEDETFLDGALHYEGLSQGAINAGSYAITPAGYSSINYNISYASGTLSIDRVGLTVTASDLSKLYDAVPYAGRSEDLTIEGFVNGETTAVLGGSLGWSFVGGPGGGSASFAKDAGHYTIKPSGYTSNNYTITYVDGSLLIDRAELTATAKNASKNYDGNQYLGGNGLTFAGFVGSEDASVLLGTVSYSNDSQGAKNAGHYTITPGGLTSNNYHITYADGALDINKVGLTVRTLDDARNYTGLQYSGGNGLTFTGLVNGETEAVLDSTSFAWGGDSQGAVNAGHYTITPGGYLSPNYDITYVEGALDINKVGLTAKAKDATKVYDAALYSGGNGLTFTGFVNNEGDSVLDYSNITYTGSSQDAKDVGHYTITPSGLASPNYTISYASGALDITPAPLTVIANDHWKDYDGVPYAGGNGLSFAGFAFGEDATVINTSNLTYGGSSKDAVNAGQYAITPGGLSANNYTFSYVDGTLFINTVGLTVTANNLSQRYTGLPFTGGNGLTFTGFVNNDNVSVLQGAASYSGNSQNAKDVGQYTITPGGYSSSNYSIHYAHGTLDITPAPLTVTAKADSKDYNGLQYAGGNGLTFTGLVNGETEAVLDNTFFAWGGDAQDAVNAGHYSITPGGYHSPNYDISYASGPLDINKVGLTAKAKDDTKVYNAAKYSGGNGLTFAGFVNGEGDSVLDYNNLTYTGSSQDAKDVGHYTITPSGLASPNYTITYASGALDITPAPLTVIVNDHSKNYDAVPYAGGNGHSFTDFAPGEDATVLNNSNFAYGGNAQGATEAGRYTITASGYSASNYTITYADGALDINPVDLSIAADDISKDYDAIPFSGGSLTFSGFVHGEDASVLQGAASYSGNSQSAKDAGQYTITPGGYSSANYVITYHEGSLEIKPVGLTVSANDDNKTYDAIAYSGGNGVTYSGFVHGEDASALLGTVSYGNDSQGAKDAGYYSITPQGLSSNNYDISYSDGTLTIDRKAITIDGSTVNTKVYDGSDLANVTPGSPSGLVGTETLSLIEVIGLYDNKNVGTGKEVSVVYTLADGSNGGLASNYHLTNEQEFLTGTITPRPLTVALTNAQTKVYDGTRFAPIGIDSDYELSGFADGESAQVNQTTGAYDNRNAGQATTVTVTLADNHFTPDGDTLLSNYILPTSVSGPGSITPKTLAISGSMADDKTYNGTDNAVLHPGTLSGLIGYETLALSANGHFDSKDVGEQEVNVNYLLADGAEGGLASNYRLDSEVLMASITPANLAATIIGTPTRAYNGTRAAQLDSTHFALSGFIPGESAQVTSEVFGTYDNANAGLATTVTAELSEDNLSPEGQTQLSNYTLPLTASGPGGISKRLLTISGSFAHDKQYDGTNTADVHPGTLNNLAIHETLNIQATGHFDGKDVGERRVFTSYTLADGGEGGRAANYELNNQAENIFASITPAPVQAVIINTPTKEYDGSSATTLDSSHFEFLGFVHGESAQVTEENGIYEATYDSAEPGPRTVTADLDSDDVIPGSNTLLTNYILPNHAMGPGLIKEAVTTHQEVVQEITSVIIADALEDTFTPETTENDEGAPTGSAPGGGSDQTANNEEEEKDKDKEEVTLEESAQNNQLQQRPLFTLDNGGVAGQQMVCK